VLKALTNGAYVGFLSCGRHASFKLLLGIAIALGVGLAMLVGHRLRRLCVRRSSVLAYVWS
jgi:hypothetical protein